MTNQEKMNQIMNDMIEYAKTPLKNGTGDLNEPTPVDTEMNEPELVSDIFCPFRKRTCFYDDFLSVGAAERGEPPKKIIANIGKATYSEEEFLPCLGEKCSAWHKTLYGYEYCGLSDKR